MLFGNTNSHFDLAHVIFSHQKEFPVNAVLGTL